ncbi:MAG: methyltransferase domain-containing protein [Planctomycetales bacterium]|nr:methyltransferase domain-containing protein [Planctomycetales bacterium]
MPDAALPRAVVDPTPIFEHFRGSYGSELLTVAVAHLRLFDMLADGPLPCEALRERLALAPRPFVVLRCALSAMGLLQRDAQGRVGLSDLAREHLLPGGPLDVSAYVGLAAESPGVLEMMVRLKSDRPAGMEPQQEGTAFIFREGVESAMESEATARHLTLSLAGRAKNVAPALAENFPLDGARLLVDVGGGSGIYSIAWLLRHPQLRAIVVDRPEVLKVAAEFAAQYHVADRLELRAGDMFADPLPAGADVALLSNILHDWNVPECKQLVRRCAEAVAPGGQVLIHDVFLNDTLDGPLPIALYSAALFTLTEGRAYSAAEYREMLTEAGLQPGAIVPTLVHCGVLPGVKPA